MRRNHPSTVDRLPPEIRQELDRQLLIERRAQLDCVRWLATRGYPISKSALGRHALKLLHGSDEQRELTVGGQTLAETVLATLSSTDPLVAEALEELITLQVHQLAVLRRLHRHLRDRAREDRAAAQAKEWLNNRP